MDRKKNNRDKNKYISTIAFLIICVLLCLLITRHIKSFYSIMPILLFCFYYILGAEYSVILVIFISQIIHYAQDRGAISNAI